LVIRIGYTQSGLTTESPPLLDITMLKFN